MSAYMTSKKTLEINPRNPIMAELRTRAEADKVSWCCRCRMHAAALKQAAGLVLCGVLWRGLRAALALTLVMPSCESCATPEPLSAVSVAPSPWPLAAVPTV